MLNRRTMLKSLAMSAVALSPSASWGTELLDLGKAEMYRADIRNNKTVENFNVAIFMSRDIYIPEANPGHTYVATARWQNGEPGHWGDTWLFGMYPRGSDKDVFKSFFSDQGVERGKEADTIKDRLPDIAFVVFIDNAQLEKLNAVRDAWKKYEYNGFSADCVSFMRDAAKAVGLKVNGRLRIDSPNWSLRKIAIANGKAEAIPAHNGFVPGW